MGALTRAGAGSGSAGRAGTGAEAGVGTEAGALARGVSGFPAVSPLESSERRPTAHMD